MSESNIETEEEEPLLEKDESKEKNNVEESITSYYEEPSMPMALLVYWVIPVLFLSIFARYCVDVNIPVLDVNDLPIVPVKPLSEKNRKKARPASNIPSTMPAPPPSSSHTRLTDLPTPYQEVVQVIQSRRPTYQVEKPTNERKNNNKPGASSSTDGSSPQPSGPSVSHRESTRRGASSDPERVRLNAKIDELRRDYQRDPTNIFKAIDIADALRIYDLQYHEGGTHEKEALEMYQKIVTMAEQRRQDMIDSGKPTDLTESMDASITSVNDEISLDYTSKSADGLLCAVLTAQGKVYYMANMFEKAVESYSRCIEVSRYYLDALSSRASALIILGRYEDAATDFMDVIQHDKRRMFFDAFTGLARVLAAKEDATEEGWDGIIPLIEELIPQLQTKLDMFPQGKQTIAGALNRLNHVMFTYHDVKTKDYPIAWNYLTEAFKHKLSVLRPWPKGYEEQKVQQIRQIFRQGFWPEGVGSPTDVPIFIVGFVRSGSTLLERVLDSHPMIVGTGENSVFNGRLDDIRNKIVEISTTGQPQMLAAATLEMANEVVNEMKTRWEELEANTDRPPEERKTNPKRFVDKMLTNYFNIGFIHLLYPNALILHVAREPMDTVFSAYKHEFPPGALDYTSDFTGLTEQYLAYRDVIEHWDEVLPGRVTHIRYEDMVNDMPGVARAIIAATGLPWDDGVLDFHKKKHAVNTLSTTQVRKGVYKDSMKSWMKYEQELQPLVKLIGRRAMYDLKTSLPGYSPPVTSVNDEL